MLFVPVLAIMGMGNMRRRTYWAWLVVAATLCFGLGFHAGHQQVGAGSPFEGSWNRFLFDLVLAGVLFVGHALVTAGDADRRWIARFPTYFDASWRQATLLALAGLFVGVFWGVLALGSVLFQAIGIRSFDNTITSDWFSIPATTIATALGLHLINSRTGMVRGARALVLGLLAWLMPLLSAIGLAFLVALPFTGLQPLWDTRHATSMLLTASIVLILLINSHFQDGGPDSRKPVLLVVTRAIAAVMLTPLVILAAYGLKLRVDQYGWSPSRVESAAVILAVACHAFGYLLAVVRSRTALSQLPATNVASAFIIVLMLLCLLSPIADPARLSVASQLHRLMSGEVSPRGFDFTFLAKNAGRYGRDALETLKAANGSQRAEQIADLAHAAAYNGPPPSAPRPRRPANPADAITVVQPAGQKLPAGFLQRNWYEHEVPACLTRGDAPCEAVLLDLDGDGRLDVLLIETEYPNQVTAYHETSGSWAYWGRMDGARCPGALEALRIGRFDLAPASTRDVIANGHRLHLTPGCRRER